MAKLLALCLKITEQNQDEIEILKYDDAMMNNRKKIFEDEGDCLYAIILTGYDENYLRSVLENWEKKIYGQTEGSI